MPEQPWSRRRALAVVVLGAGSALTTGCGIRLEEDAPRVPLVPQRTPIPAEDALVLLLQQLRTLAAGAEPAYADGLARQVAVLDSALRERGVPQSKLAASPSATSGSANSPGDSSSPSESSSAGSASGMSSAAATVLAHALVVLEQAEPALRPTLAALTVAEALLLAQSKAKVDLPAPGDLPQPAALALIVAAREAAYGLEVVAARTRGKVADRAKDSLQQVRGAVLRLEAMLGAQAPASPTAYLLPLAVTDDDTGRRLAKHLTGALLEVVGSALPAATAEAGQARAAVGWLAEVARLDARWGAPWTPFPGLT